MTRFQRELRAAVRSHAAAELIAAGQSKHVIDGPRWHRTARGYYRPAGPIAGTPTQRIVDAAALLPQGGVIGGWAAAYALGADQLDGYDDRTMRRWPVTLILPPGHRRSPRPGIRYEQRLIECVNRVGGVPFTAPVVTAVDLARAAPDLTEAVVALDALLQARVVTPAGLAAADLTGGRGARQARSAFDLARGGVRSTWETRLRLLYVADLGLPTPLINQPVFDHEHQFLGAPDLLDVEAGLALEFDGAGHRDRQQHRRDNVREERLERAGLIVTRADSLDLLHHRAQLAGRLRAARAGGLARDRSADRWTLAAPPSWLGLPA